MATKRLIDANEVIERAKEYDNLVGTSIWETCEVVELLEDCPIMDAVEVIRCGKCRHYDPDTSVCQFWHGHRSPAQYCSEGEIYGKE